MESAVEVRGMIGRKITSKLFQETKYLIRKRKSMIVSNATGRIELAELSKTINKRKQSTYENITYRDMSTL